MPNTYSDADALAVIQNKFATVLVLGSLQGVEGAINSADDALCLAIGGHAHGGILALLELELVDELKGVVGLYVIQSLL